MSDSRAPANQPRSALRAPVFWLALIVLVVNDHLLKGAGVLPAVVTGKLSDFAGLVVAPVVVAELCRGPLRRVRATAVSLVVLAFVLTEVWPGAARAVELALGLLGVHARLWPDPTDLLALAVLPLTFRVLALSAPRPALAPAERLALCLGGLACLATSDGAPYGYGAFLVNHSGSEIEVQLRFHDPVDCDAPLDQLADALEAGTQPPEQRVRLLPAQVLALDAAPMLAAGVTPASCNAFRGPLEPDDAGVDRTQQCVAVRIAAAALPPHLMRARRSWSRDDRGSRCAERIPVYEDPGEGALVIGFGSRGARELVAHERVELLALP